MPGTGYVGVGGKTISVVTTGTAPFLEMIAEAAGTLSIVVDYPRSSKNLVARVTKTS
jgi:hypothetical protein